MHEFDTVASAPARVAVNSRDLAPRSPASRVHVCACMTTNISPDLELIAAHLSELKAKSEATNAELSTLEEQLRSVKARGTRDVTTRAAEAVAAVKEKRGPWFVGDDGPTSELVASIAGALAERPMGHAELVRATGARSGRISGALVEMRRARMPLVNISEDKNRALYWFATPDAVARATTKPRNKGD